MLINEESSMKVHEKLKAMRLLKGWSQEALRGYAKIEQGVSDINLSRLQQIADTLEISLEQLLGLNENNVYHIAEHYTGTNTNVGTQNIYLTESQCIHELEKSQLLLKERDKEIKHQQEIIELLKKDNKTPCST